MQTTLDLQNAKKLKYNTIRFQFFFKFRKCTIFPKVEKMGHMKKLCECPNFGLIEIVIHKVTSFVS